MKISHLSPDVRRRRSRDPDKLRFVGTQLVLSIPYVYILKSDPGSYYVGSTTDLKERIKHHKGGHTKSTKALRAKELVFSQEYDTLSQARWVERKLKSFKRKDFIEKIIKEGSIKIAPP